MVLLEELIDDTLRKKGIGKLELIERLGYENLTKGLSRFDRFMKTGTSNDDWLEKVAETLQIDMDSMMVANRLTVLKNYTAHDAAKKMLFQPYIEVLVHKRVGPSMIWVLAQSEWKLSLPRGLINRDNQDELGTVKKRCKDYLKSRKGKCLHSEVIGFRYHREYGRSIDYDEDLKVVRVGITPEDEMEWCGKNMP